MTEFVIRADRVELATQAFGDPASRRYFTTANSRC